MREISTELLRNSITAIRQITARFIDNNPGCERSSEVKRGVLHDDTKKREILKNPTKIQKIPEKNLLTEIEPLQLAF